jgi:hypothetical protein
MMSLSLNRKSVQCRVDREAFEYPAGDVGSWELEALEPMDASEGVEAEVVEKVDMGRDEWE